MNADLLNAIFEFSGALFILNHCRVLLNHKDVKGVSVLSTVWFFSWGVWNLYYYPSLGQNLSFIAGCIMVISNLYYVWLLTYYKYIFVKHKR